MIKNIRTEFTRTNRYIDSPSPFSHALCTGTLRGSEKSWILKEMEDPTFARAEILGQEFFRLIIPGQPETRLLEDDRGVQYILSEEIAGYKSLPTGKHSEFLTGKYKGLGQVLVTAMFVEEFDLKNGNIGLDSQHQVRKIDGDWCFAREAPQLQGYTFDITERTLDGLPRPYDFDAFHWLDFIQSGSLNANPSAILDPVKLSKTSFFREEVNDAILKICLLPDDFLGMFIDSYTSVKGEWFVSELIGRRNKLQHHALNHASFLEFLTMPKTEIQVRQLLTHMESFKANGSIESILSVEQFRRMQDEVLKRAEAMFVLAEKNRLSEFLTIIEQHQISKHDDLTKQYVATQRACIEELPLTDLRCMRRQAERILASVSEPSLAPIIARLHSKAISDSQARRLEMELCRTPLLERGKIRKTDNPVMAALDSITIDALLNELERYKINFEDKLLLDYIADKRIELALAQSGSETVKIRNEVLRLFHTVRIDNVQERISAIEPSSAHLQRIIAALSHVPLTERFSVLDGDNAVVAAFASRGIDELLDSLEALKVNTRDRILLDYVANKRLELQQIKSVREVAFMRNEVQQMLLSMQSEQVTAVQDKIQILRNTATLRTFSKRSKADRIEQSLLNTPLAQRGMIITGPQNPVQEALSAVRRFKHCVVPRTKRGEIDLNKASNMLKDLQARFGVDSDYEQVHRHNIRRTQVAPE